MMSTPVPSIRMIGTLVFKEPQDTKTTNHKEGESTNAAGMAYYIHPRVVTLFEESQGIPWSTSAAIELLRTQNEFEPGFISDDVVEDCEHWSEVATATYRGQPMSTVTYRPEAPAGLAPMSADVITPDTPADELALRPAQIERSAAMDESALDVPLRTMLNPEFRDFYKKVNITPKPCAHCQVLLPIADSSIALSLVVMQQKDAYHSFVKSVASLLGPINISARDEDKEDGENIVAHFGKIFAPISVVRCARCNRRVCHACRHTTKESALCIACDPNADDADVAAAVAVAAAEAEKYKHNPLRQHVHELSNRDPEDRENAAKALGALRDRRATDALIETAREDPDWRVRQFAAEALGQLEDWSATAVLSNALTHWKPEVVAAATAALGRLLDPQAFPLLPIVLRESAPTARVAAARALGESGDTAAVAPLIDALEDSEFSVQLAAAEALGALGDRLAYLTGAGDVPRQESATTTLDKAQHPDVVQPLLEILSKNGSDYKTKRLREAAAQALCAWGDPRAADPVHDAYLRQRAGMPALVALAKLADPRAFPLLIKELQKPRLDHETGLVADALAVLGDRTATAPLLQALSRVEEYYRANILHALGELGDPSVFQPILDQLHTKRPGNVAAAVEALGKLRDPRAVAPLLDLSSGEEKAYSKVIAEALGNFGDASGLPVLVESVKDDRWEVREAAAEALGKLRDNRAAEPLLAAIDDHVFRVTVAAIKGLGYLSDPRAKQRLTELTHHSDPRIQAAAQEALQPKPAPLPPPVPAESSDHQPPAGSSQETAAPPATGAVVATNDANEFPAAAGPVEPADEIIEVPNNDDPSDDDQPFPFVADAPKPVTAAVVVDPGASSPAAEKPATPTKAAEEQGWSKCSHCGERVKSRNLSRHEAKCRELHEGESSQSDATDANGSKKKEEADPIVNTGAWLCLVGGAVFLIMVWMGQFSAWGFGTKVLLTIASPCVILGFMIVVMIPMLIVFETAKSLMKKHGISDVKQRRSNRLAQFAGIATAMVCLLPILIHAAAGFGDRGDPPADKRTSDSDQQADEHGLPNHSDGQATNAGVKTPVRPDVSGGAPSDRQRLQEELREARAKLAEAKRARNGVSGPIRESLDQAIETMEATIDVLEEKLAGDSPER